MNVEECLSMIEKLSNKRIFDTSDIDILLSFSRHEDSEIRYLAAELMVDADGAEVEDRLISLLNDPDYLVRISACDSLSYSKNPQVIPPLLLDRASCGEPAFWQMYDRLHRWAISRYGIIEVGIIYIEVLNPVTEQNQAPSDCSKKTIHFLKP